LLSAECFFKDREDETSQLNRLVWLTLFFVYFQFQPPYIGLLPYESVGAQSSADFFFPTQVLAVERNFASAAAQVLAEG
jgi:hypothetical protein